LRNWKDAPADSGNCHHAHPRIARRAIARPAGLTICISYYQIALMLLKPLVSGEYFEVKVSENETGDVTGLKSGEIMAKTRIQRVSQKQALSNARAKGFLHRANQPRKSGGCYDSNSQP
jgi:hypothetical protein